MTLIKRTSILALFSALLILVQNAWANYEVQSIGANGYDVVAYHTQNKAVPGANQNHSFVGGVTYLFATKENKDLFDKSPKKYLPAYGGYCAMAMTLGKKHLTNPEAFLIVKGKLYLNKADVREKWLKDVPGNIKKADEMWQKVKEIDPAKL